MTYVSLTITDTNILNVNIEVTINRQQGMSDGFECYYPLITISIHNRTGKSITINKLLFMFNGSTEGRLILDKPLTIKGNFAQVGEFDISSFYDDLDFATPVMIVATILNQTEQIASDSFTIVS